MGDDLAITSLPGDGDATAARLGDKDLFFADADVNTDTLLAPIAGGVEIFEQLDRQRVQSSFASVLLCPMEQRCVRTVAAALR